MTRCGEITTEGYCKMKSSIALIALVVLVFGVYFVFIDVVENYPNHKTVHEVNAQRDRCEDKLDLILEKLDDLHG